MILACGSPLPRLRFLETYGDPKHPHAANTRLRLMVSARGGKKRRASTIST